jgi:hypothetical protein
MNPVQEASFTRGNSNGYAMGKLSSDGSRFGDITEDTMRSGQSSFATSGTMRIKCNNAPKTKEVGISWNDTGKYYTVTYSTGGKSSGRGYTPLTCP